MEVNSSKKAEKAEQKPIESFVNKIICGDALKVLRKIPTETIDCVVTSPPYYALRDYEVRGQIGQERDFTEYIGKLLLIFGETKRVLKKSGTCWIVIGDTYGGSATGCEMINRGKKPDHKFSHLPSIDLPYSHLPNLTHRRGKYANACCKFPPASPPA